jgi:hypothetical protein
MTTNAAGTVAIDLLYHWQPIGPNTPRGVKLQLVNKRDGVAYFGLYNGGAQATHWAPLPTFAKGNK